MISARSRRKRILDLVETSDVCTYTDLAEHFGVSSMTIRRDVEALERERRAIKTLRGIRRIPSGGSLDESHIRTRVHENMPEKQAIARAALELVAPGQTLFLDGGTTCLEFARALVRDGREVTAVTHSVLVCAELGKNADNTVICLGGQYDDASECLVGPACEEMAARYFVDLAVMSTKAFLPETGTMESAVPVFRIKQTFARQAARTALLVDHTKFGQRALCGVLDIGQIHVVVTDDGADPAAVATLRLAGRDVRVGRRAAGHRAG